MRITEAMETTIPNSQLQYFIMPMTQARIPAIERVAYAAMTQFIVETISTTRVNTTAIPIPVPAFVIKAVSVSIHAQKNSPTWIANHY